MSSPYFGSIQFPSDLRPESGSEDRSTTEALFSKSASKWGRRQLEACRVLTKHVDLKLLPSIDQDKCISESVMKMSYERLEHETDDFWRQHPDSRKALQDLINNSGEVDCQPPISEHALVRRLLVRGPHGPTLGQFLAALKRLEDEKGVDAGQEVGDGNDNAGEDYIANNNAGEDYIAYGNAGEAYIASELSSLPPRVASTSTSILPPHNDRESSIEPELPEPRKRSMGDDLNSPDESSQSRPKRPRRAAAGQPIQRPGMTHYDSETTSEEGMLSHEQPHYSSSFNSSYKPDSESRPSSERPEELTIHLASTFIRYVLYWAPPQHEAVVHTPVDFDDAELPLLAALHDKLQFKAIDDGGLRITYPDVGRPARVAMIEAKRALQLVGPEELWPIPDARFAQIVGEAVAMRLNQDQWAGPKERIFVIVSTRYYLRFLELQITDAYIKSLTDHAIGGDPYKECLEVHATDWFNLRQPEGRLRSLRNLSGIVHVAHRMAHPPNADEDDIMSETP